LARRNLQVTGRAERRRFFIRSLKFFFGLMLKLLVSAIGLSGSLPEFLSSFTDLVFAGLCHGTGSLFQFFGQT
jgi:hypothetical protein